MHDAVACEQEGTAAVAVMTTNFVGAAELMSRVLGLPDCAFGVIDHPVSSATDAGLRARAEATVEALRRIILRAEAKHVPSTLPE